MDYVKFDELIDILFYIAFLFTPLSLSLRFKVPKFCAIGLQEIS